MSVPGARKLVGYRERLGNDDSHELPLTGHVVKGLALCYMQAVPGLPHNHPARQGKYLAKGLGC